MIRQSIVYAESAERAVPILDYRPKRGVDYLDLAAELLGRLGWDEQAETLRRAARRDRAAPGGGIRSHGAAEPADRDGVEIEIEEVR